MNHVAFMTEAKIVALKGQGHVSPNPMVGCVLVVGKKIIAKGHHHYYGGDHAEVDALKQCQQIPKNAIMYVTLEPCHHWGKTPPCVEAILRSGIKQVVIGCLDPNPLTHGKSVKLLRAKGIKVDVGVMADELMAMNEAFNFHIINRKPFVTAKIAQSIDGKVAMLNGDSKWITSQESRDYARRMRYAFDAIMVGKNTVMVDNPKLTTEPAKRIKKVICDTRLSISPKAQLFVGTNPEDVLIYTALGATSIKVKLFKNKATLITVPVKNKQMSLDWIMSDLYQRKIAHILIEGGPTLVGQALQDGLVNKLMIYIAPKILGEGLSSVGGFKVNVLAKALRLNEVVLETIGEDMLLTGYLKK